MTGRENLIHVPADDGDGVWIGGTLHTVKAGTATTSGSLSFLQLTVSPGDGPPPHIHTGEDETLYILSGEFEFFSAGRTFAATAGDLVHVPRGTLHGVRNVGESTARALTIYTPGGMDRYFTAVGTPEGLPGAGPAPLSPEQLRAAVEQAPAHGLIIPPPPDGGPPPPPR
ncbi:cupin domain-containing protein [Actinophytocola gossypii]|uniref:cupin domain-containing protein n=1 Tax=Actinophytocola gossypii TaxID=2812003 RepID=UPI0021A50D5F|nr:cupin domain-containing protein [Actinophytocola gossypii]